MRMRLLSRVLLITTGLLTLPACHNEPTQEEACAALAQASCDALQRCSPDSFNRTYADSATCLARQRLSCSYQFPANSNTPTQRFIDCAKAVPGAECSQILINQSLALTNLADCRPLPGNQDNGTLCSTDAQCKSTFCDKGPLSGLCGTCAQRALLNEDCDATACDFGLICTQESLPNRCVTPYTAAAGQSCDQSARCQKGLTCVGQKCVTLLKAGEACMPGQGNDACDRNMGLYCDQGTQRCTATQYAKVGQSCGGGGQNGRLVCSGSSKCINDQVCLGPAGDGQTSFYPCLPPAVAVNGVCTLPDPGLCR